MKNDLIEKYIHDTFYDGIAHVYTSDITCDVYFPDGIMNLLCLGGEITVYLDGKPYETVRYMHGNWYVKKELNHER